MARRLAWGAGAAALYVGVALASFQQGLLPVRPLLDGSAPVAPYRWVNPPAHATQNQPPETLVSAFPLEGEAAINASTADAQAIAVLPRSDLVKPRGVTQVRVEIRPLDPATLGEPPPDTEYDGNAYSMSATYVDRDEPVRLAKECVADQPGSAQGCFTIVMRYALGGATPDVDTKLYRREGSSWTEVESQDVRSSLQVFTSVGELGTFVAAGPDRFGSGGSRLGLYLAIGLSVAAAAAAAALARWRIGRKRVGSKRGDKRANKK